VAWTKNIAVVVLEVNQNRHPVVIHIPVMWITRLVKAFYLLEVLETWIIPEWIIHVTLMPLHLILIVLVTQDLTMTIRLK
jgi:hypothetical protein